MRLKNARGEATDLAHPLAGSLASQLRVGADARRVLLLGVGSGRNVPPLLEAGLSVEAIEPDPERTQAARARFAGEAGVRIVEAPLLGLWPVAGDFAGALSTHALLHGDRATVLALLAAVGERLRPGAPFFLTLGSAADPRCGTGTRIDDFTWLPAGGSEAGVPHVYFSESDARALLRGWVVDSLDECSAAESAGRWAHTESEAARMVHWFVRARRGALI